MTREDVFAALFALLTPLGPAGNLTFKTLSRRLTLVETLDPTAFPAVYQQQIGEQAAAYTQDGVSYWIFDASWYIYSFQANAAVDMTPTLNVLVEAVQELLEVGALFIGGQRTNIQIIGTTYWEGVLKDRAVARIDLRMKPVALT